MVAICSIVRVKNSRLYPAPTSLSRQVLSSTSTCIVISSGTVTHFTPPERSSERRAPPLQTALMLRETLLLN
ncbi:hypothetical protein BGW80DRAFT_1287876 [Lactifluus volemus]|nr:hypothetical protein BGW80DRAFT_1287876 [Lactifluus volemus]